MMKLYSYFRSSTSYRARIALNIKGLDYDIIPVHLLRDGGEQYKPEYRALNPQAAVPTLDDNGFALGQSLAIIEYLDDTHPDPALVFGDAQTRARIRQLSLAISCEIHPVNNLHVLQYLTGEMGLSDEQKKQWYAHWCREGMAQVEQILEQIGADGPYCMGEQVSMADTCLIPQLYNLRRFNVPYDDFNCVAAIEAHCLEQDAFKKAAPENQPDTPEELKTAAG